MLLGLAVGDALGAAVEFEPPGTFDPVTDFRAGGPHGLEPGEWTDDTSMALALADSIADVGWDLNDQAERYLAWWQNGAYSVNGRVFDIGVTTSAALSRFRQTGDAWTAGDASAYASGNGSIMRLAPILSRSVCRHSSFVSQSRSNSGWTGPRTQRNGRNAMRPSEGGWPRSVTIRTPRSRKPIVPPDRSIRVS